MPIVFMCYCPHPPVMIGEIGGSRVQEVANTRLAMADLAKQLGDQPVDTVVVITSHGPVFEDGVAIWREANLTGSLQRFGLDEPTYAWSNDLELGLEVIKEGERNQLLTAQLNQSLAKDYKLDLSLDHGILVPLSFFPQLGGHQVKLLPISIGLLPYDELYLFGMAIQRAIETTNKRVAVIISGDLSHRLTQDAPGGYHPRAKEFDHQIKTLLEQGEVSQLLELDEELIKQAGECGLRPLSMGLGIIDQYQFKTQVGSYEAPFGVGYLVAQIELGQKLARGRYQEIKESQMRKLAAQQDKESAPVKLARETVTRLVGGGQVTTAPKAIPGLEEPAGVFVSIKKKGQLRGCMGTVVPTKANATLEIVANAMKAAFDDPRFEPITKAELDLLTYSVDLLGKSEPISGTDQLDPQVYGVIVESGGRRGLLLPNLTGIEDASQQVAIAKEKAGIGPNEPVQLFRFEVIRYY